LFGNTTKTLTTFENTTQNEGKSLFGNTGSGALFGSGSTLFGAKPSGSLFESNKPLFGEKKGGEESEGTGKGGDSPTNFG